MRLRGAAVLALLALAVPGEAFESAVKTLESRPGVTESFLLVQPETPPVASVVLFAGGEGVINLQRAGNPSWGRGNFLVRSRGLFAQEGFLVALLDVPSDHASGYGRFRVTREHAQDVAAVIADLRRQAPVPVWLVGTSRGTVSAANAAARLRDGGPDGLVLTSSVTRPSRNVTHSVLDVALDEIRVPTLIVHHRQDGCSVNRFDEARLLPRRLERAPRVEFLAVDGGTSSGDPCEGDAHHGFAGIAPDVVQAIAAWIRGR
jgi:pimeloyl-ACP methyl ester carboxylesterase